MGGGFEHAEHRAEPAGEIPAYPGPGAEPWWWKHCSPGSRSRYVRVYAKYRRDGESDDSPAEIATLKATLPEEVGFECTFYEGLFYRTAPLRKSLYVVVATDSGEFRPNFAEHFPRTGLAAYQLRSGMTALGQREPVEIVFRCYSPAGSGDAKKGARIIGEAIEVLRGRLELPERSRSLAAMRDSRRFVKEHWRLNMGSPYRPPSGTPRGKSPAPNPRPRPGPSIGEEFSRMFRGELERRGVLEDYDRMRAKSAERRTPLPAAWNPYDPAPWLEQYRAFERRQEAMQAEYGRWNGGGF